MWLASQPLLDTEYMSYNTACIVSVQYRSYGQDQILRVEQLFKTLVADMYLYLSPQNTSTLQRHPISSHSTWRSHGRHQVLRKVLRYLIPTIWLTLLSYNRYLAITARVVRRSLKEQPRLQAERRGEMDLRFAKWTVSRWIQTVQIGDRWINSWLCRMASKARSKVWQARTQRQWQKELGRHSSKVLIFLVVGWAGNCTYGGVR